MSEANSLCARFLLNVHLEFIFRYNPYPQKIKMAPINYKYGVSRANFKSLPRYIRLTLDDMTSWSPDDPILMTCMWTAPPPSSSVVFYVDDRWSARVVKTIQL